LEGETEMLEENLPKCHLLHNELHMLRMEITFLLVGFEILTAVVMKSPTFCLLPASLWFLVWHILRA
jgi:hypothetical protein